MIARQQGRLLGWVLLALGLLSGPVRATEGQAGDPLVLVVNKGNTVAAGLNKAELKKILLGERSTWPNGAKILIILRPAGSDDRGSVLRLVLGMNESLYTRYQMKAAFTGDTPALIKEAATAADVKNLVRTNPTALGFVHKKDVDETVKSVLDVE